MGLIIQWDTIYTYIQHNQLSTHTSSTSLKHVKCEYTVLSNGSKFQKNMYHEANYVQYNIQRIIYTANHEW